MISLKVTVIHTGRCWQKLPVPEVRGVIWEDGIDPSVMKTSLKNENVVSADEIKTV